MKYKYIIFDFDGVLAESVQVKTDAFFKLYSKYGQKIVEKVIEHHKANGGMSRFKKFSYYHKTLLNIELSKNEIKNLSNTFSDLVMNGVIESNEVPGASWFLNKYFKIKHYWIVSATPTNEIQHIAEQRGIANYFVEIYGSPTDKIKNVCDIIEKNNLDNNKIVFLGDAINDFEAAAYNDIQFILRETPDNKPHFSRYDDIKRFTDFYELEKLINKF